MPKFKYQVKDKAGKTLNGVIDAETKDAAIQSLRSKELIIISKTREHIFLTLKKDQAI